MELKKKEGPTGGRTETRGILEVTRGPKKATWRRRSMKYDARSAAFMFMPNPAENLICHSAVSLSKDRLERELCFKGFIKKMKPLKSDRQMSNYFQLLRF